MAATNIHKLTDKYITSRKLSDAKELFDSKQRTYSGNMRRISFWGLGSLSETERYAVLETGFFDLLFTTSVGPESWDVDTGAGVITLRAYAVSRPQLKILLNPSFPRTTIWYAEATVDGYYDPDVWYNADGSHIGDTGAPPPGETPMFNNAAWDFQDNLGAPIAAHYTAKDGSIYWWALPVLPETKDAWADMQEVHWTNASFQANATLSLIQAAGLRLTGLILDFEDVPYNLFTSKLWEDATVEVPTTLRDLYQADPRYVYDAGNPDELYYSYLSSMFDIRVNKLVSLCVADGENLDSDYIDLFDISPSRIPYFDWSLDWHKINGRRKSTFSCYPYGTGTPNGIQDAIGKSGWRFWDHKDVDSTIQNAQGWIASSLSVIGANDNPIGNAVSVAHVIGATKILLAMGCTSLIVYDGSGAASHHFYSVAIGYNEMQSYHDIIKNGTTIIPDNRKLYDGKDTLFYELGDDDAFVTCRVYRKKLIFVGFSTDDWEKVCILTNPINGEPIVVKLSPYGYVTCYDAAKDVEPDITPPVGLRIGINVGVEVGLGASVTQQCS